MKCIQNQIKHIFLIVDNVKSFETKVIISPNTQLHSQIERKARRAWQLQNINQHSASLHVD